MEKATEPMVLDETYSNKSDEIINVLKQIAASQAADADTLDAMFQAPMDCTNTTSVFKAWFPRAKALQGNSVDRYALLERFAKMMAQASDGLTFTLRGYIETVSSAAELTPLDDLAEYDAAQLCTEDTTEVADWADEHPMGGWYVRFNALSLSDGTMNVTAIEGVDADFDVTGINAPVYTGCMSMYRKWYQSGNYEYKSFKSLKAPGYSLPEEACNVGNTRRYFIWHPTTAGFKADGSGSIASGGLSSGSGHMPALFTSESAGLTAARITGAYEGLMTDQDSTWALDMWQLRHFNKENSGIAEGCTSYNYDYTCAVAESDVTRVIVTVAQGANLVEGSSVWLESRAAASTYAQILSKETVTISDVEYVALNLDLDATISPTTSTHVLTAPWLTGSTDKLPGHKDGCIHSLTAGKGPLRVMGVEYLIGCYDVGADPLYNVTANADSGYDYAIYTVRDATLQSTAVTNYTDTGLSYEGKASGWEYVKAFIINTLGILFPKTFGGSSTTYYKSAFYGAYSAGVRVPWRRCGLGSGGYAGLAGESGDYAPSTSGWDGAPRLGGSGKTRGTQAA